MIARLTGEIAEIRTDYLILEVQGVGYKVENFAPYRLGLEGQRVSLEIYTHVKEDELRLFGFSSRMDLDLFRKLLSVSGVGPKVAMLVISTFSVNQIVAAIRDGEPKALSVKGLGTKTVAKILIELKGKVDDFGAGVEQADGVIGTDAVEELADDDLSSALQSLGYTTKEIASIDKKVDREQAFSAQVKQALGLLRS